MAPLRIIEFIAACFVALEFSTNASLAAFKSFGVTISANLSDIIMFACRACLARAILIRSLSPVFMASCKSPAEAPNNIMARA